MSFKDHFSALAAQYARYRPRYPAELFSYLARLCAEHELAWDCACGSGQATLSLAAHFQRVCATDASAQQIAAAQPHPLIEYRVAPAEYSGLPDGSADLITVAQALHWFDVERFYAEANRVLKPAGVLAVWTYGDLHAADASVEAGLSTFRAAVESFWPEERGLVLTGYRTLRFPFAELESPRFELQESWSLPHLVGYLSSWSAVARYAEQNGADPLAALEDRLRRVWADPQRPLRISWPLSLRVGRKSLPG